MQRFAYTLLSNDKKNLNYNIIYLLKSLMLVYIKI
jgi:hypothetical protein